MPIEVKIATAVISLVVAHELGAQRFRKKANANRDTALMLLDEHATMKKQLEYLARKMDDSDIELDEFDLIVLTNL